MTRRELLASASVCIATGMVSRAFSGPTNDLDFASALDAAAAIKAKQVSSLELTRRMIARIDRYNPKLNAFAYQMRDQALAQAREADTALSRGDQVGPFHGVPICVKELFGVKGEPDTWGIPALKGSKAPANSTVVQRLLASGAVLLGGTNVPQMVGPAGPEAWDWQSYNDIYGTTNNPWDLTRTPGGSSGGSAAALAAGLSYLSAGSDIGGSLRVPAAFCGIYSHKPTLELVSLKGYAPGGVSGLTGFSSTGLSVAGPMARSAPDLMAALQVLGGPDGYDRKAWSWTLPLSRKRALKDFRVGYVFDSPMASPTSEVGPVLQRTISALERTGAPLRPGWPRSYNLSEAFNNYMFLLSALIFSREPKEAQESDRTKYQQNPTNPFGAGALSSYAEWQQQRFRQLAFRALWQEYFEEVDVFLMPCSFTVAFHHNHERDSRTLDTPDGKRPYMQLMPWMVTATLTGCPATAAPIGQSLSGLPVGIQIMGPFWEDATPIEFAALLNEEIGGFKAPPGYGT